MKMIQTGMAGTLESSDVLITVEGNGEKGNDIQLSSIVKAQYGKQIIKVVEDTLDRFDIRNVKVSLEDKGALDCTIRARLEAALFRGAGKQSIHWEELA